MKRHKRRQAGKSTEINTDKPSMKTAKQRSAQSLAAQAFDRIKAIIITATAVLTLILLLAFYYITWSVLSIRSHAFVTTWAIVATTLIFVSLTVGVVAGLYIGLRQSDAVLEGVNLAVSKVILAAERVSEVRVTTMGRYGRLGERKGTQEWVIDNDLFGVARPRLDDGQDGITVIDVPADEKGRKGE